MNREMYVYKSTVESGGITERFHWQRKAALWLGEGRPLLRRVSRCVRSFSESRVVYPISGVKANVGRLCEKLKIGMRNGLRQNLCR